MAMDEATLEAFVTLADTLYNDALRYDRAGDEDMATACLELTEAVMLEIAAGT